MESLIPGIVLLAVLIALFIFAANKYNKSQQRIAQHIKDGNIIPQEVAAATEPGKEITLTLLARHFENVEYLNHHDCVIARALKEMFPDWFPCVFRETASLTERGKDLRTDEDIKSHRYYIYNRTNGDWVEEYGRTNFEDDRHLVEHSLNLGRDSIVRYILLTKHPL